MSVLRERERMEKERPLFPLFRSFEAQPWNLSLRNLGRRFMKLLALTTYVNTPPQKLSMGLSPNEFEATAVTAGTNGTRPSLCYASNGPRRSQGRSALRREVHVTG